MDRTLFEYLLEIGKQLQRQNDKASALEARITRQAEDSDEQGRSLYLARLSLQVAENVSAQRLRLLDELSEDLNQMRTRAMTAEAAFDRLLQKSIYDALAKKIEEGLTNGFPLPCSPE